MTGAGGGWCGPPGGGGGCRWVSLLARQCRTKDGEVVTASSSRALRKVALAEVTFWMLCPFISFLAGELDHVRVIGTTSTWGATAVMLHVSDPFYKWQRIYTDYFARWIHRVIVIAYIGNGRCHGVLCPWTLVRFDSIYYLGGKDLIVCFNDVCSWKKREWHWSFPSNVCPVNPLAWCWHQNAAESSVLHSDGIILCALVTLLGYSTITKQVRVINTNQAWHYTKRPKPFSFLHSPLAFRDLFGLSFSSLTHKRWMATI